MARRSRSTTIADVARLAGVSAATVSRVMNSRFVGEPGVADRVRAAAAELDYSPSHLARSLALGQTSAVAFVVPDLANPAFQAVLAGFSKAAARDGYRALVADSAESPGDEPGLAAEIRRRCDALVLCAPRMPERELQAVADILRPLVVINRPSPRPGVPALAIDYRSGIRLLAEHLHTLGHRRLVYVEGPASSVSNAERLRGIADFEASVPGVRVERVPGGAGSDDGVRAADAVRDSGATAALAFNDLVAIGLMNGLAGLGMRVPDDISVTGFDDIPFSTYASPSLTTASVPHRELGAAAWDSLLALIRKEGPGGDVMFGPRLEVRRSTAAPAV